jgi:putative FmdB family regulatory protein
MPLFDYRCAACGHTFEALVRPNGDGTPDACPECGAGTLDRLPSMFASTSREQRQAAADKKRHAEARIGREETAAREREVDAHRHEDH